MQQHLERLRATTMPGCPLDVAHVDVSVSSAETGYWVRIAARNRDEAKEVLARTAHLVR